MNICVFCGSSTPKSEKIIEETRALGRYLGENSHALIYGGASIGLMGTIADAVLETGGEVIGIIPFGLGAKEIIHHNLTELVKVQSMHERKTIMYYRADAFIALPGGYGTMDELFETLTWEHLEYHTKPIAVLNIQGFFDPLLGQLQNMKNEGLLNEKYIERLKVFTSVEELENAFLI
jgi:uncharacterized protein (TIGR00730 family)